MTLTTEEATQVANTIVEQIGRMNILAISGGRGIATREGGLILPVGNGYKVTVDLDFASDTYTVRRIFVRGAKTFIKGELTNVYCDEVGEIAYQASCFRSYSFGAAA